MTAVRTPPTDGPARPGGDWMPAITVRQPWAQMIAEAAALHALGVEPKRAENRGRRVDPAYVGCDWAIHSGKTFDAGAAGDPRVRQAWIAFTRAITGRGPSWTALTAIGDARYGGHREVRPVAETNTVWFPRGAVIAVAELVDVHPAVAGARGRACCPPWGEMTHQHGRSPEDNVPAVHLVWDRVRRLSVPVEYGGQVVVPWRMTGEPLARVRGQLG